MKLLVIFTIGFIALKSNANSIDHKKVNMKDINELKEKRGIIGGAIIAGGITAGASILGIGIKRLMSTGYSVAVAGSIENYSKVAMIFEECEVKNGKMNKPMVTVHPGEKEGFASHKSSWSFHGSWVYCTYRVSDRRVHIMYDAPYTFHYSCYNTLALAITMPHVTLSASDMFEKRYSFMAKRQYYYSIAPTKICDDTFCITGTMGYSHKPEIKIKLYPRHFYHLSHSCKDIMRQAWHKNAGRQYSKFIKNVFNYDSTVIIH